MLTYFEMKRLHASARDKYRGKPYGNNLRIVKTQSGYALRHHNTNIIEARLDHTGQDFYILNNGGWYSITTKKHLNTYGPVRIYQSKGQWYYNDTIANVPYVNGLKFKPNGQFYYAPASRPQLTGDLELSEI